jgi:hypothetical protein
MLIPDRAIITKLVLGDLLIDQTCHCAAVSVVRHQNGVPEAKARLFQGERPRLRRYMAIKNIAYRLRKECVFAMTDLELVLSADYTVRDFDGILIIKIIIKML